MRRSTTSAGTDRRRTHLCALLVAELICGLLLLGRLESAPGTPAPPATASHATSMAPTMTRTLADGRTAQLVGLEAGTAPLLARIDEHLDDAVDAVTTFWGPDWPREVVVVAAGTDAQFALVAGGDSHTAATTTEHRITFAPGAAAMSDDSLRIVLRHELFHFAARGRTAADAPRWLTEGVADYVARPNAPLPPHLFPAGGPGLPTDADLAGPDRSQAYDRAWSFARFVADTYGVKALRALYLRACGPGPNDVSTAVAETLGADLAAVLADWRRWTAAR